MITKSLVALLLEDEPWISLDIELTLADAGFEVTTVRTCEDADAWLTVCRPDIVVVDILLADGPCHDVVAKLVAAGIPFVVHSGDQPSMHEGTPLAQGRWISKPSSPETLIEVAMAVLPARNITAG